MSEQKQIKRANPTVIGAFVLAALVLVAVAIIALGGASLFRSKQPVVSFFEGSVKGLVVGAAVNFRGVKVGSVDRIELQFAPGSLDARIPVYMTLLPDKVRLIGSEGDGSDIPFDAYIQKGLRSSSVSSPSSPASCWSISTFAPMSRRCFMARATPITQRFRR